MIASINCMHMVTLLYLPHTFAIIWSFEHCCFVACLIYSSLAQSRLFSLFFVVGSLTTLRARLCRCRHFGFLFVCVLCARSALILSAIGLSVCNSPAIKTSSFQYNTYTYKSK